MTTEYRFIIGVDSKGLDIDTLYPKCADALVTYRKGGIFLEFDRKSKSFAKAVKSAITDIESTGNKVTSILAADGGI